MSRDDHQSFLDSLPKTTTRVTQVVVIRRCKLCSERFQSTDPGNVHCDECLALLAGDLLSRQKLLYNRI